MLMVIVIRDQVSDVAWAMAVDAGVDARNATGSGMEKQTTPILASGTLHRANWKAQVIRQGKG